MKLPDKVYDVLKWVALIFMPAVEILYSKLAQIWGLPYGEQIVATIAAVDLFLGVCLGVSTLQYNKKNGG